MRILGIADNHDSGAALSIDGELVAACGQERIDRVKTSGAFPWGAIDAVLDIAGLKASELDRVVVGTAFTPSFILRAFPAFHEDARSRGGQFSYLLNLYVAYQSALKVSGLHVAEVEACRRLLHRRLSAKGIAAPVEMVDHHAAHAHAAYRTQPHADCLVLTVDAMGDGTTCTAWTGKAGHLHLTWAQSGFSAINTYYSRVTEWLGFRALRHEGKITGLAAYATAPEALLRHFRGQLRFVGPGFNLQNYLVPQRKDDPFFGELARYSREEVAAALQTVLEEAVCELVAWHARKSGLRRVALCGGVFANVKMNQRIANLPEVDSIWVYPNMGDGGLAAGGLHAHVGMVPHRTQHLYLGPRYSESQIARELHVAGIRAERPADLEDTVARLLAAGKVVARFDGAMEWGPRALGNRSILFRPDDPSVNDWLNKRLKRTEFMPFAPAVLAEDADRLFVGFQRAADSARFMTVCFDCGDELKEKAAGVVHVDGTARPQVVHREENPGYYRIIERFKAHTGIPAIINTSFNMHEEPIVCSPYDAIRSWRASQLDALAIGPFLVTEGGGGPSQP